MTALNLKNVVSEDLSLRNMVSNIFKAEEFKNSKEVLIDFAEIKSMSRSFAHEYLQHKADQLCTVLEVNVPSNIKKMFEVVKNTKVKSELIKDSVPIDICIPQK